MTNPKDPPADGTMTAAVRLARVDEAPTLDGVLADAFFDDPIRNWRAVHVWAMHRAPEPAHRRTQSDIEGG